MLNWIDLVSEEDLAKAVEGSNSADAKGVVLFKHSTRCSISSMAKSRLERNWDFAQDLPVYYLDLIAHRNVSNAIAKLFNVEHESPQIFLIRNGKCVYDASHTDISVEALHEALDNTI